jgi:predicted AAA+ superfamily ATPase
VERRARHCRWPALVRREPGRSRAEGRLVENAVGAHQLAHLHDPTWELTYFRDRNDEVDYVVRAGTRLWAIEVKSGRPARPQGLAKFLRAHRKAVPLILGSGGMPLTDFFARDPREILVAVSR